MKRANFLSLNIQQLNGKAKAFTKKTARKAARRQPLISSSGG